MTVEFTKDGKVTWYEDGEPTYSTSFSTGIDKTTSSLDPLPVIYFSDELAYAYSFPDDNTLVLVEDGCDGFSDKYQRV
jgi:hypothetical protein